VSEVFWVLFVNVTLPVTFPTAAGANVTLSVADSPDPMTDPEGIPLTLKPDPEIVTFEIVILVFWEFVTVARRTLVEPTATLPKIKGEGVALSPLTEALGLDLIAGSVAPEDFAEVTPTHPDSDMAKSTAAKTIKRERHMRIEGSYELRGSRLAGRTDWGQVLPNSTDLAGDSYTR
jgi:hypothetical protein